MKNNIKYYYLLSEKLNTMNTYMTLFGIIVVMAIIYYITSSYSLQSSMIQNDVNQRTNDRVRCPPQISNKNTNKNKPSKIVLDNQKPSYNISFYEDEMRIKNKGFVNELMYRPAAAKNDNNRGDGGGLTVPSIPLNDVCDTQNVPIANIHVSYLIDKTKKSDANLIL